MADVIKMNKSVEEVFLEGLQLCERDAVTHAVFVGLNQNDGTYCVSMSTPLDTHQLAFMVACLQERLMAAMRGEPW